MGKNNLTIAFDFDGVIHKYSKGWQDGSIYDPISTEWIDLVKKLFDEGHKIFILSTRPKKQIYEFMSENVKQFIFRVMPDNEKFYNQVKNTIGICNHKAVFDVLVDDRAIGFKTYDGLYEKIKGFSPL